MGRYEWGSSNSLCNSGLRIQPRILLYSSAHAGENTDENAALHSHLHNGALSSFLQTAHRVVSPRKSF